MLHSQTTPKAFTLIELLVVIAIIAILMGLLFPAVNGALTSARRATAKNDVVQIANAVVMYETEYGRLPPLSGNTVSGDFLQALMATSTNNNARRIVFLEAPDFRRNRGGVDGGASGVYRDPWGGAYQIAMDTNFSNVIASAGAAPGPVASNLRKRVAVWNAPLTHSDNPNTNTAARRAVASWD